MAERKPEWREAGNLIITSKKAVTNYGAYVEFDENNKYILVANKACEQNIFRRDE
jgi:translation initiation factor 2 alpha subunit (eIF-2alpha)